MRSIRILFLAANSKDTTQLRLSEEVRAIDERLQTASFREHFELMQSWAVRATDLSQALLRYKPHIVHFSGHGSASGQIILEDESGMAQPVPVKALSDLFGILSDNIRCVVLNACFSQSQANAIVQRIECVVGMSRAISDSSAIAFAAGFYRALGWGRSIQTSFLLGCNEIDLANLGEADTPKMLTRSGVDPASVYFLKPDQPAKNELTVEFMFTVETLKDGQMIRRQDLPLTIEGQYSSKDPLRVWVVLQDSYRQFYIQNPEITFLPDGRWIATNILPGMGIEFVHFVRVDERGHARFREMVVRREFGASYELPPDSAILRSIHISRIK